MAHDDRKGFNPVYQTVEAGQEIKQGAAVALSPSGGGQVFLPRANTSAIYGVAGSDVLAGQDFNILKMDGGSEAVVRTVPGSYSVNDYLYVNGKGEFVHADNLHGRIWGMATETKTTTAQNPLLAARLLYVNSKGLSHYQAGEVVNRGTPVKLNGDGHVVPVDDADDFVFGVAAEAIDVATDNVGSVYRRGDVEEIQVVVAADDYVWGDPMTINASGQFVKQETADGRFWAICREISTNTASANDLVRVELIMGKR